MRSENYRKNIGKVLAIARHANNMTRVEVQITSGVSLVYIGELENEKKTNVSEEILTKLGKVYDLSLEQIYELASFYSCTSLSEKRKFRQTLKKALEMMENNIQEDANNET